MAGETPSTMNLVVRINSYEPDEPLEREQDLIMILSFAAAHVNNDMAHIAFSACPQLTHISIRLRMLCPQNADDVPLADNRIQWEFCLASLKTSQLEVLLVTLECNALDATQIEGENLVKETLSSLDWGLFNDLVYCNPNLKKIALQVCWWSGLWGCLNFASEDVVALVESRLSPQTKCVLQWTLEPCRLEARHSGGWSCWYTI